MTTSTDQPFGHTSLTYLEFYSGVGGWSFALQEACHNVNQWMMLSSTSNKDIKKLSTKCLGAYDHSDLCYKVFKHNFPEIGSSTIRCDDEQEPSSLLSNGKRKTKKQKINPKIYIQKPISIEKLTKGSLEEMRADIWVMSPPCQPHTRQHNNQKEDIDDPRSQSFLHLCDLISSMELDTLPKIILLENVIGFENSNSCKYWRRVLFSRQYSVLHFHLNPPQVGLPNDRPRYYGVAIRRQNIGNISRTLSKKDNDPNNFDNEKKLENTPPIMTSIDSLGISSESKLKEKNIYLAKISSFLDPQQNTHNNLQEFNFVSEKILKTNASWCFDIVTTSDTRSACFTSSYGKYVRGTGSVLYVGDNFVNSCSEDDFEETGTNTMSKFQLVSPEERNFDTDWNGMDLNKKLRYFTGLEMARLMGFPISDFPAQKNEVKDVGTCFSFPSDCSQKQQWKLMGNSLNVKVAGKVAELALRIYLESQLNVV